jgi:hypothetical protein
MCTNACQHPTEFGDDPLTGDLREQMGKAVHRIRRFGRNVKVQDGRKPKRAQNAECILVKARIRIADTSQNTCPISFLADAAFLPLSLTLTTS